MSRLFNSAILGLALIGPALLAGCDRQSGSQAQPQPSPAQPVAGAEALKGMIDRSHKGSAIPAFTLKDAAGQELALQSLKGKPLLLNLWATWCAPCIAELPMLDSLARQRGANLRVLTVSQDMSATEKVAPFLAQRGFARLEPWIDPAGDLGFQYGVTTLPTTIYYDAAGREVWRFVGGHDWSSSETAGMLAERSGG